MHNFPVCDRLYCLHLPFKMKYYLRRWAVFPQGNESLIDEVYIRILHYHSKNTTILVKLMTVVYVKHFLSQIQCPGQMHLRHNLRIYMYRPTVYKKRNGVYIIKQERELARLPRAEIVNPCFYRLYVHVHVSVTK